MGKLAMTVLADVAEQAALFALSVDHDKVDPEETNGHNGIAIALGEEAIKFCQQYQDKADEQYEGDTGLMWDAIDWYKTSDEWFDEHIAPKIY